MRCRFGLKVRLVLPVTLRPTPPRYLALPRRAYWLPPDFLFPVMAHCWPMTRDPFARRRLSAEGFPVNWEYIVRPVPDKVGPCFEPMTAARPDADEPVADPDVANPTAEPDAQARARRSLAEGQSCWH